MPQTNSGGDNGRETPSVPGAGRRLFGEIAVARGFVSTDRLSECLDAQLDLKRLGMSERIGQILIKRGCMKRDQVVEVLREQGTRSIQEIIEGYEILGKIGQGGMGAVFKAVQKSTGRVVALKILPPRFNSDEVYIRRFLREARVAAKLNHPNIVACLDAGVSNSHHFIAMEFVEGENLEMIMKSRGKIPESEALDIAVQIAEALDHANRKNLVHRDIKPSNIMIAADKAAKLLDMGLARGVGPGSTSESNLITQAGIAVGTPTYISPEQAKGAAEVDIRSDIYSLGATLYHMLTGKTPYSAPSAAGILVMHISEPIPRARDAEPSVSPAVSALVESMMAKSPANRFADPEALLEAIRSARAGVFAKTPTGRARSLAADAADPNSKTATIQTPAPGDAPARREPGVAAGRDRGTPHGKMLLTAFAAGLVMMAAALVIAANERGWFRTGNGDGERHATGAPADVAPPVPGASIPPLVKDPPEQTKTEVPKTGIESIEAEKEKISDSMEELKEILIDLVAGKDKPSAEAAGKIIAHIESLEKRLDNLEKTLKERESHGRGRR